MPNSAIFLALIQKGNTCFECKKPVNSYLKKKPSESKAFFYHVLFPFISLQPESGKDFLVMLCLNFTVFSSHFLFLLLLGLFFVCLVGFFVFSQGFLELESRKSLGRDILYSWPMKLHSVLAEVRII